MAFCHRSASNEINSENNERLEFLGDSVLGLVASEYLYKAYPELAEGELAKLKSSVVSEKALSYVALQFEVDKLLVLGHGEELSGGRKKNAILADCTESIIGAYFLDSGFEKAREFVHSFLIDLITDIAENGMQDWKTLLQELYQKNTKKIPVYETVSASGPDHSKIFSVVVKLGNKTFGPAKGKNKKEAEQKVAELAYKYLTESEKCDIL